MNVSQITTRKPWPGYLVTFDNEIDEENTGEQIGILIGILAASFVGIFILIGACILSHVIYMRFLKKPWTEPTSKSVFFIELDKKESTNKGKSNFSYNKSDLDLNDNEKEKVNSNILSSDDVELEQKKLNERKVVEIIKNDSKKEKQIFKYSNPNCIITQV